MIYFGACYYPEHRDPDKWEYDLDLMATAHVNCLRVGEFAWNLFEPSDGVYDFAWMDGFNELAAQRRIQLVMCPPLRTIPAWMMEQDSALKIEREDGVRLEYGSRYSFCINHPLLLEKGEALVEKMAKHYGQHTNIAGWHLDNEHGDEPDCHCPICREKFQQWCQARYGTIEELNRAWGLRFWGLTFSHFGQIPTPRISKTFHSPGHLLAWRRFRSHSTVQAVSMQAEVVRQHAQPNQFVTTNQQTWNSRTDNYDLGQHLDVCGLNYYPPYGATADPLGIRSGLAPAMSRSYKARSFHVYELRNSAHMIPGSAGNTPAPGEVERLSMHCVANGADGIFYFRWRACPFGCEQSHGTITDYDGRPKRMYQEISRVGERLHDLAEILETTRVQSRIAVLFDFPTRWVMETGVAWNGPQGLYMDHCQAVYRGIRQQRVNCDVVHTDGDFSQYAVVVVPLLASINDELADKFCDYVEQGGTLVWHPLCGIKDPEAVIYPERIHPRLKALMGAEIREFATLGVDESTPFRWMGKTYAGKYFCDLPTVEEDVSVLGEFTGSWFAGTPALIEHPVGAGRMLTSVTFGESAFYSDLCESFCREGLLKRIIESDIPECVEIVERRSSAGKRLIFLLNGSHETQRITLDSAYDDLYQQQALEKEFELAPYGVRMLVAAEVS